MLLLAVFNPLLRSVRVQPHFSANTDMSSVLHMMIQIQSVRGGGVLLSGREIYFTKEIIRSFKLGVILSYRGTRHLIINAQSADNSGVISYYRNRMHENFSQ